ncbi:hypothetical protein BDV34DRAFT_197622 [Aspergillus parasiticus]|uniref:Uncharacterized protein n=1 Tax=Aspergillus parasiticus TaxID=5067 RepID=A0A5N6DGN7_ASPPA|nr:hypothetical protein BDV34DRAFT_197622 [Aspergillus parasiticus]
MCCHEPAQLLVVSGWQLNNGPKLPTPQRCSSALKTVLHASTIQGMELAKFNPYFIRSSHLSVCMYVHTYTQIMYRSPVVVSNALLKRMVAEQILQNAWGLSLVRS